MDTTSSFVIFKFFGPPPAPEAPKKLKKNEKLFLKRCFNYKFEHDEVDTFPFWLNKQFAKKIGALSLHKKKSTHKMYRILT